MNLRNILLTVFCQLMLLLDIQAQKPYLVKKINESITIDGKLDEPIWQNIQSLGDFYQYFPSDTSKAKYNTQVFIAYDSKFLYIACEADAKSDKYVVPSLRRDFRAGGNDNITFMLDTFHDNTNCFIFGLNPYGVQREGLVSNGGTDTNSMNMAWDNKWYSEATVQKDKHFIEVAIPFSTLRYKENSKVWNFKSYRFDTQGNEVSSTQRMNQNILIMSLGFSMPIEFEEPLHKNKSRVSLIPYVSGNAFKDISKNISTSKLTAGADAKIAVTTGLNLDLTVNPDFSTVEADRQQVNLSRFDITFPEQRQFFTENSDLFTNFGAVNTNPFVPPSTTASGTSQIFSPFFSRKVGIALDSTTGTNIQTPIVFGARLSGKLDDNWRIGLLNTQTDSDLSKGIKSTNYSVAAITRRVFERSNIGFIFVNKSVADHNETDAGYAYSRVAALEYNLQSKNNKWRGKAFYSQAFTPSALSEKLAHGFAVNYTAKRWITKYSQEWVGKGFESEAGFVPRNNFLHLSPTVGYLFFPKKGKVQRLSVGVAHDQFRKLDFGLTDDVTGPFMSFAFRNSQRLLAQFNRNYTYLFNDFDVLRTGKDAEILKKGTDYTYWNLSGNYVSDLRKAFSFSFNPLIGQYFSGTIIGLRGETHIRFQPKADLGLIFNVNQIDLPVGKNNVMIIGPKTDITFTKNLYWTTYVQYNSQFKNVNVNSRLQYRFAPVSDLFIVYSDNYDTGTWGAKNRAIIAKATYWLNL
jgi:hypothetical protein